MYKTNNDIFFKTKKKLEQKGALFTYEQFDTNPLEAISLKSYGPEYYGADYMNQSYKSSPINQSIDF